MFCSITCSYSTYELALRIQAYINIYLISFRPLKALDLVFSYKNVM